MKIFVVLLAMPMLALCQDDFRSPPNCLGNEEAMPKLGKCVSTQVNCGGGTYNANTNVCTCASGYMRGGQHGEICIPQCTGTTSTCTNAGGNCTAVNFCSCGTGFMFSSGQCVATTACGG